MTTETATHTTKVVGHCNGGAKSRRVVCSCGYLGVRFAYIPGTARDMKTAQAKAEREGIQHVTGSSA